MPPLSEGGIAAGKDKALAKTLDQIGKPAEVTVVSGLLTGQECPQGMVKIIVPLGIQAVAAGFRATYHPHVVQIAFGNNIDLPSRVRSPCRCTASANSWRICRALKS